MCYFGLLCWFYFYIKICPVGFSLYVVFFFLSCLSHLSHLSDMFAVFMAELISVFCLSGIWGHSFSMSSVLSYSLVSSTV